MNLPTLGIDIAKLKFNACLIDAGGKLKHKVFPNTLAGFRQLADWLAQRVPARLHACLEATGAYGEALAPGGYGAAVCSPFFQAWVEGMRQRGKSKMAVIGAAMRKLVHLAYGVLKTGKPFDPQWV
jgi:Transposase